MSAARKPLSAKQKRLYELMSDISEDCYCAGWMIGNEYTLWSMVENPEVERHYGLGCVSDEQVAELKSLSESLDGWVIWWDDDNDKNAPIENWGERFVPMAEWLALWRQYGTKRVDA